MSCRGNDVAALNDEVINVADVERYRRDHTLKQHHRKTATAGIAAHADSGDTMRAGIRVPSMQEQFGPTRHNNDRSSIEGRRQCFDTGLECLPSHGPPGTSEYDQCRRKFYP